MSKLGSDLQMQPLCASVCVCLFLFVFPHPYRVGWLSVWVCPGLWRSIWSESHLSDCKWTACPRDARQLSGSPRKRQAGSREGGGGGGVSGWAGWDIMCHQLPYATSLSHRHGHTAHGTMFICDCGLHTLEQMVKARLKSPAPDFRTFPVAYMHTLEEAFYITPFADCGGIKNQKWIGHFKEGFMTMVINFNNYISWRQKFTGKKRLTSDAIETQLIWYIQVHLMSFGGMDLRFLLYICSN